MRLVTEALVLLHRRARLVALAQSYDDFYGGEPAPLSDVTAALYGRRVSACAAAGIADEATAVPRRLVGHRLPADRRPPDRGSDDERLRGKLSSLTVVLNTGTKGPPATHVELDAAAGLTKYPVSYANVTELHTVPVGRCRTFRGRLSPGELARLEAALAVVLGLPPAATTS